MTMRVIRRVVMALLALPSLAGELSLDGSWEFRFEEGMPLESVAHADFAATETMPVPCCFDVTPKYFCKRGTALYRRTFTLQNPVANACLVVDGMGLRGQFKIDGRDLGIHPYPYARLELETGPLAAGEHVVFAALDNRFDWNTLKLATPNYDFHLYGGFYHGVRLALDNRRLLVRTRDYRTGTVEVELLGDTATGNLVFDGTNRVAATWVNGRATVRVPNFRRWSPEQPNLHMVCLQPSASNRSPVSARFGIREIAARDRRLWLNGRELYLKGANRHEAHPSFGAATPEAVMMTDIQNLKALGGNFFRGAHYQQCARFLDLCDENGVLVWEESLGWGDGTNKFADVAFCDQQVRQTREMVLTSLNHPSVVFAGFLNEFKSQTPSGRALAERLVRAIRACDSGRLVTWANNRRQADDICTDLVDVIAINTYPGWIAAWETPGGFENLRRDIASGDTGIDTIVARHRALGRNQPIIVSEMGICGIYGQHDPAAAQWTEEFQDRYVGFVLDAVFANPEICGISIWQFTDARSYHIADIGGAVLRCKPLAQNLAGLYDGYRRPKAVVRTVAEKFAHAPLGKAAKRRVSLAARHAEVVIAPKANPAVRFAAEEMTNFLSRVLGAPVPIAQRPGKGKVAIVLGTNDWSAAAGVEVSTLKRDGFVSGAAAGKIFIAGRDDPKFRPFYGEYDKEIGTLYGVYDFLERYAGCRFYFPGELGEIVPRRAILAVPEELRKDEPAWKIRRLPTKFGAWYEKTDAGEAARLDYLFRYRLRTQTQGIPCCHGLSQHNYSVRFGETHPEYFQLKKGKRTNVWEDGKAQYYHSMLCHSSGIWDEIYKDALSYFRGERPEVRGIVFGMTRDRFRCRWGWNVSGGKYFDAMPQDGMSKCECTACQAAYAKAKNPDDWANELIWGRTVELANRLTAAGFGDRYVTQMSYFPYKYVPDIDIPSNVLVMVCSNGSWVQPDKLKEDTAIFRAWYEKRHGNIWAWNNSGKHKCFNLNIADYPCVTPHAFGSYYKMMGPLVFGAYCDNSAERFLYSALNYYLFCKIAWSHGTDADALLSEYYALMFGKAAEPMRRVFETIEDKWMNGAIGHAVETSLGTVPVAPTQYEVWTKIYNPSVVRQLTDDFAAAVAAVPANSLEGRRVAIMRHEFLDPIVARTSVFLPEAAEREEARRKAEGKAKVVFEIPSVTIAVTEEMTGTDVYDKRFRLKVEPGKTYRVSYFLTCDKVKPYPIKAEAKKLLRRYGGVQCAVLTTSRVSSTIGGTGNGVQGDFRRVLQECTVTFPEKMPPDAAPTLVLRMYNRTGKARFEDLLMECLE